MQSVKRVVGRVGVADEAIDADVFGLETCVSENLEGAHEMALGTGFIPGEADAGMVELGEELGVPFGEKACVQSLLDVDVAEWLEAVDDGLEVGLGCCEEVVIADDGPGWPVGEFLEKGFDLGDDAIGAPADAAAGGECGVWVVACDCVVVVGRDVGDVVETLWL